MNKEEIEKSSQRLYDDAKRQKMKLESKRKERMIEEHGNNIIAFEDMLRNSEKEKDIDKENERDLSASKFRKKKKTPKYNFIVNNNLIVVE